jgi:hypothetical protein
MEECQCHEDEALLVEIDRVIRATRATGRLREFVAEEQKAPANDEFPAGHHPDAAAVLSKCRQRHPSWRRFPDAAIRIALRLLLHDRWSIAIWRTIECESSTTADRLMRRIARLAPARLAEDTCWVWCHLIKREPGTSEYHYTDRQIRGAWRVVMRARARSDRVGAGGRYVWARKLQKAARKALSRECARPTAALAELDLADYDPSSGAVSLPKHGGRAVVVLSAESRERIDLWLLARGSQTGRLLSLPTSAAAGQRALGDPAGGGGLPIAPIGADGLGLVDDADFLERHCAGQPVDFCRFIRENIGQRGDWPQSLIDSLDAQCADFDAAHPNSSLTAKQRRRRRSQSERRWRRLSQ